MYSSPNNSIKFVFVHLDDKKIQINRPSRLHATISRATTFGEEYIGQNSIIYFPNFDHHHRI